MSTSILRRAAVAASAALVLAVAPTASGYATTATASSSSSTAATSARLNFSTSEPGRYGQFPEPSVGSFRYSARFDQYAYDGDTTTLVVIAEPNTYGRLTGSYTLDGSPTTYAVDEQVSPTGTVTISTPFNGKTVAHASLRLSASDGTTQRLSLTITADASISPAGPRSIVTGTVTQS